ncbi:hypothetical protein M8C13_07515 [Crossiella sp. SN42]|uniref:ParB/RepB/Spo0J family partition protein n=1 Tax=Crossiella sp. SN42 TaxID=2944808 RepID=UPI00207C38B7|nr:hypothetical protein [Crossiella sp. SN42]MCO1575605.1 hypothetical protein [Crossiella sp. SN42]
MPPKKRETTAPPPDSGTRWEIGRTYDVDPADLVLVKNIRTDDKPLDISDVPTTLVDSVGEFGVLTAIEVFVLPDGKLGIFEGHQRQAAAIHHGLPTVKVLICERDPSDTQGTIVGQVNVNCARSDYSDGAKLRAVEQLLDLGMPEESLRKAVPLPEKTVTAALAARRSTAAAQLVLDGHLDMFQGQAFANYDDNPVVSTLLEKTITEDPSGLDHVLANVEDNSAMYDKAGTLVAAALNEGIKVVYDLDPATDKPIRHLSPEPKSRASFEETSGPHRNCPGHAVLLVMGTFGTRLEEICLKWRDHGHHEVIDTPMSGAQGPRSEEQKAKAALARKANPLWKSAQKVRQDKYLPELFARNRLPLLTLRRRLMTLAADHPIKYPELYSSSYGVDALAAKFLAIPDAKAPGAMKKHINKAGHEELTRVEVARFAAAAELGLNERSWRDPTQLQKIYFRILEDLNVPLQPVERMVNDPSAKDDLDRSPLAAVLGNSDSAEHDEVPDVGDLPGEELIAMVESQDDPTGLTEAPSADGDAAAVADAAA